MCLGNSLPHFDLHGGAFRHPKLEITEGTVDRAVIFLAGEAGVGGRFKSAESPAAHFPHSPPHEHVPADTSANRLKRLMAPSDTMVSIAAQSNKAHDVPDPSAGGVAASTTRAETKHMPNVSQPPEAGAFGAGSAPAAGFAVASSRNDTSYDLNGATNRQDIRVSGDVFPLEQSWHHVMSYSPYPPFAPISATTTCSAGSSSSSSSLAGNSDHGKTPTITGFRNETPSFYL